MKKIFLKSVVFFACLAVGGLSFWSSGYLIGNAEGGSENALQPPSVIDTTPSMIETTVVKKRGKGLEVKVKEIVDTGQGLAVDFEITNFDDESYFYNSYEQTTNAEPIFLLYSVKINGKEENLGWCGTGLKDYELKSGESKIVRVSMLSHHWKKGKSLQFGFNLAKKREKNYQTFWSENLRIDETIARQLSKEKAQGN